MAWVSASFQPANCPRPNVSVAKISNRRTTMPSKKTTVAAIAAFIAIVASPAFAGDQNVNTLLRDSGRYVPQVNEPATHYTLHPRAPEVSAPAYDFQLQGR